MALKRRYWAVSLICLAVALFCLAYPFYVIWPFRYQGGRELQVALFVTRYRGIVEVMAAAIALAVAWASRKTGLIVVALTVLACAALSRVNLYERMFRPISTISFGAAADSKLDGDEKMIAVVIGSAVRAYPVRSISYHHIVNDVVGDVPIVATY